MFYIISSGSKKIQMEAFQANGSKYVPFTYNFFIFTETKKNTKHTRTRNVGDLE